MTDISANLSLPYLLASQAQKHVTFNELVNKIDALLMLSVLSMAKTAPPDTPAEGQRYIIAANATGDWAGNSGQIAVYQNLSWIYINPQKGFIVYVEDENKSYLYNGTWGNLSDTLTQNDSFTKIGIGTGADSVNPFAAKLNNALFSAQYSSEGGDGNLRLKVNKENTAQTASLVFQDNWSGRAEFGLLGNDNFGLKISSDGTNWATAFYVNSATNTVKFNGNIDFPADVQNAQNAILKSNSVDLFKLARANNSDGYNTFIGLGGGGSSLAINNASSEASYNSTLGFGALKSLTSGNFSVGVGVNALYFTKNGKENTSVGAYSMFSNTGGNDNVAIGHNELFNNTTGSSNTALGQLALVYKTDGTNNTNFSNCSGIGQDTRVSGSNQVQLGNSTTTTYVYGTVQNRSDIRDKADIRDTVLGLDFINALRPVDFKWDMRDDYFEEPTQKDKNGNEQTILTPLLKDGSKKRNRYHHGLIAQEVKENLDTMGIDFGGYQDHSKNGGSDVLSIGYDELIAPLIKAVQELSLKINELKA